MTRGRLPKKGLDDALLAAQARGRVMSFSQNGESICDFMIMGNGMLIFVRIRKARRIHGTLEEIERQFQDTLLQLRSFSSSNLIRRELWIYSRHCTWRFFCIGEPGIVEICQNGAPQKSSFVEVLRTQRAVHKKKVGSSLVMVK